MKKILMIMLSMGFMAMATSAQAGTAPGTINVTATAVVSCTVTSSPVSFGTYDGSADVAAPMASVGQSCNGPVNAVYSLDGGGTLATGSRHMNDGGANLLAYELYQDSAYTAIFGDGTHGTTKTFPSPPTGLTAGHAVWGRILAGQTFVPGSYSDVVNVTITY